MKQMTIQSKKLTLNKTTITRLGNTWHSGYRAMDSSIPLGMSTLPACNSTATSSGVCAGIVY